MALCSLDEYVLPKLDVSLHIYYHIIIIATISVAGFVVALACIMILVCILHMQHKNWHTHISVTWIS